MFALAMVTCVSLVGMVWFRSFQKDMYALLNGEQEIETRFFAQSESKSLFGYFKETLKDGQAFIGGLFNKDREKGNDIEVNRQSDNTGGQVHTLPISGDKE